VILITGGYGLLGKQFSKALAAAGAKVVIGGRDYEKALSVAEQIGGWAVEIDVSKRESVDLAVQNVAKKFGVINGLINNASYSSPADNKGDNFTPFEDFSETAWKRSLDVDVTGMFFCAQHVGKLMVENGGGVILNISSVYGINSPDPRIYKNIVNSEGSTFTKPASYCVAKSAILNLTRYLAIYWREKNIRVNTLTLGGVSDGQNKSFVDAYSERTPLSRMANPDEYNGSVLFLLSDASSYMTGANLVVDGGWTAW